MRRGTTPTVRLSVSNKDGSDCDLTGYDLHVTFEEDSYDGVTITKRESDEGVTVSHEGKKTIVSVKLTQAETLSFSVGNTVKAQVRAKHANTAIASGIAAFKAEEILLEGEI